MNLTRLSPLLKMKVSSQATAGRQAGETLGRAAKSVRKIFPEADKNLKLPVIKPLLIKR